MELQIFPDLETLSHRAAAIFVDMTIRHITTGERVSVAISGGTTPRKLFTLLGSITYSTKIDWHRVHIFWVDERCVHKEHEESNFKVAFETLISKVSLPFENIHRIKGEEEPEKAAREYEDEIRRFFDTMEAPVFNLIILGVGEDGHTASLFPDSRSLKEKVRLVIPVYMEKPKRNRITLTLPILNNASQILFIVAGPSKAAVIQDILEGNTKREQYPAGLINPVSGNVTWLIDERAAEKLTTSRNKYR